jgi:hypothetical protein
MALSRGNVDKQQFDPAEVEDEGVTQAAADEAPTQEPPFDTEETVTEEPTKAQEPEPEPAQQAVATRPQGGSMVTGSLEGTAADDGFEGLDFGFGSFPICKLDDGVFVANDEEMGDSFTCVIQSSKKKILYRTIVGPNETPQLAYTYDDEFTTKSERVADVLADWKRGGDKYTRKEYLDVTAFL